MLNDYDRTYKLAFLRTELASYERELAREMPDPRYLWIQPSVFLLFAVVTGAAAFTTLHSHGMSFAVLALAVVTVLFAVVGGMLLGLFLDERAAQLTQRDGWRFAADSVRADIAELESQA